MDMASSQGKKDEIALAVIFCRYRLSRNYYSISDTLRMNFNNNTSGYPCSRSDNNDNDWGHYPNP